MTANPIPLSTDAATASSTAVLTVTRAARGEYAPDVLDLGTTLVREPRTGEVLVDVLYLSIDPTNRNWLKLEPVNTLVDKVGHGLSVGAPMMGEAIVRVISSQAEGISAGDLLAGVVPWQERAVVPAARMRLVDLHGDEPLEAHLTIFSHIGVAAMVGLHEVARIRSGETVLISAAAGATGRVAVGIAKAAGCRVIGIAGGPDKCAMVQGFGADAVVDYKNTPDLAAAINDAAPDGVDVYFDNVGGATLDAALLAMRAGGRIAVCGLMADYDDPDAPGVRNMFRVLVRHLRIEGFLAAHYWHKRDEYYSHLRRLLREGVIVHAADMTDGLGTAPDQLGKLFRGANNAKLLVRLDAAVDAASGGSRS
ncbi:MULTISPECIES: NADP-dependent oxidoreductase [unclassified Microbacterium]|uniref:MDR family NADP-dependent oxidoreductase n=1 Tax=unclassified Microbacterium TaxID=2609290 RepID=UPI000C2C6C4C|nr:MULTISPECIES: NADP-dependent oxidoreductase [unclassified Microbacterium]